MKQLSENLVRGWLALPVPIMDSTRSEHTMRQIHDQTLSTEEFRLSQVYPSPEHKDIKDTDVDIIAIHGLDTTSPKTWTWVDPHGREPKRKVNWLQDPNMLPARFPTARIFTLDWPASLFKAKNEIEMSMDHLASRLLHSIETRPGAKVDRPILFIASCLGGVVLTHSMVTATRSRDEYTHIWKATGGIIFLATPFRGTSFEDVADWAVSWLKITTKFEKKQLTKLLKSLKASTPSLEKLVQDFTHICQQRRERPGDQPLELAIFYETRKTNLLKKVFRFSSVADAVHKPKLLVPPTSGCLDIVPNPLALPGRSHIEMNKFAGPDDSGYIAITGKIDCILTRIREGSELNQADNWIRNEHYTEDRLKIERLSGDKLSMKDCYINLAILKHTEQPEYNAVRFKGLANDDSPLRSSPFSLLTRLKIETPDQNLQVQLTSLFNQRQGTGTKTRRILIRGQAGVGKTTLCKKIIHDFLHQDMWSGLFDRILWVPLRTMRHASSKELDLGGLFHYLYFKESNVGIALAKTLWDTIVATKGETTLFILDGLDEVASYLDLGDGKGMLQLLERLLQQPNLIITSRPNVIFPSSVRPVHLKLETIGFFPDQVKQYVENIISDPQESDKIKSFLQEHLLVQDLVRIPINLDAICFTWNEGWSGNSTVHTMTTIYKAIGIKLWKKDILRLEKQHGGKPITKVDIEQSSSSAIEGIAKEEILLLEDLAFTGLHNDIIEFLPNHQDDIYDYFNEDKDKTLLLPWTLPRLSFLRTSNPSRQDERRSYHFLHLTFQEYFAARYFVRQWSRHKNLDCIQLKTGEIWPGGRFQEKCSAVDYLKMHKYNARYDVFWRFVTGLFQDLGENDLCELFAIIEKEPRDLLGPVHQRLVMHCLNEVYPSQVFMKFQEIRRNLEGQLRMWLLWECNRTDQYSKLASEKEFPERVLTDCLRTETVDKHVKNKILNTIRIRPVSATLLQEVAALLKDENWDVRSAAARALNGQSKLPEGILQGLVTLLKDPYRDVRWNAVEALGGQSKLAEEILQELVTSLKDADWHVRSAAATALGRHSNLPEEILQGLVASLKDAQWHVRRAAAEALRGQPKLSEGILQDVAALLKDADCDVSSAAADVLRGQSKLPEGILQGLVASLKDANWTIRSPAAEALRSKSNLPEGILEDVAVLLKDADSDFRCAAAQALRGQSNLSEGILQGLLALLKDADGRVQSAAAEALHDQSKLPEGILMGLVASLKDADRDIGSPAAKALGGQSKLSEESLQGLVALLKDANRGVRSAATEVLSGQPKLSEGILQGLVASLKDPYENVRSAAAEALRNQLKLPEEILEDVAALLKDADSDFRHAAARALRGRPKLSEEILRGLVASLKDAHRDVCSAAARALGGQSQLPEGILQDVVALLKDVERDARSAAAVVLRWQSKLPERILQGLVASLNDTDWDVRSAAAEALRRQSKLPVAIILKLVALKNLDLFSPMVSYRQLSALSDEELSSLFANSSHSFDLFYDIWLKRSFSEHITWLVEDTHYSINMPEGIRKVPCDLLKCSMQAVHAIYPNISRKTRLKGF